ncbi:MAG: VOC family protein [Streptosporangiales bacterium]|nr:VOC family protein [Streptosporangiales bacterium]
MSLAVHTITFDSTRPGELGRWWAKALGYELFEEDEEGVALRDPAGRGAGILFLVVPEEKAVKNRMHLDLEPDDQEAEVKRLLALGARRADVGQTGEESWVVLADPDGNEFCVLGSR